MDAIRRAASKAAARSGVAVGRRQRTRGAFVAGVAALALLVVTCGGHVDSAGIDGGAFTSGAGKGDASVVGAGGDAGTLVNSVPVDKVDLLFMIDNSASMGDKQALLAQAVPDMITRLVTPNCVDSMGKAIAPSDANGQCAMGKPEFPAVHDMHIGIVSSSLGGRGNGSISIPSWGVLDISRPDSCSLTPHRVGSRHVAFKKISTDRFISSSAPLMG
jgi:hypothetical protein